MILQQISAETLASLRSLFEQLIPPNCFDLGKIEHTAIICPSGVKAAIKTHTDDGDWSLIKESGEVAFLLKKGGSKIVELMPDEDGWNPHFAFLTPVKDAIDSAKALVEGGTSEFTLVEMSPESQGKSCKWIMIGHIRTGEFIQLIWRFAPLLTA